MKIYLGCDHRGLDLKNRLIPYLNEQGNEALDIGIPNSPTDDYTDFAFKLGELVRDTENSLGVLICGSGVGMSIAANKVKGIRCVRAVSVEDAYKGKSHNGCNVIALGADITTDFSQVIEMVNTFILTSTPQEERHKKRVHDIMKYEEEHS